jgi:hypothetical protein
MALQKRKKLTYTTERWNPSLYQKPVNFFHPLFFLTIAAAVTQTDGTG